MQCKYLATRGMVAMTADYRVSTRNGTKATACVEDGKSAVRWIRKNARKLGVDPAKVAAIRAGFEEVRGADFQYDALIGDRDPPLDYRASLVRR